MNTEFLNENLLTLQRNTRDQLLKDSDKYLLPDYPINESNLILIKNYRQQLRDYMDLDGVKNYNSSNNIPFPDFPRFPF